MLRNTIDTITLLRVIVKSDFDEDSVTERKRAFRGDRLHQARIAQGLTQVELAERLKASKAQIVRYESGEADPSIDLLLRLVIELSVSSDWLIGVVGASKQFAQTLPGLSLIEMQLIESLRENDTENIFRVIVRALDERNLSTSQTSPSDNLEPSG